MALPPHSAPASPFPRLIAFLIALGLTIALAAGGIFARLDRTWHDFLQRALVPDHLADPNTAIVLIDEQSLEAMGAPQFAWRWPWPRQAFAALLAALHRAGAREIIVDLAFVELSGSEMDEMLLGAVAAGAQEVTLASLGDKVPVCWGGAFRAQHPELFSPHPRWGSARMHPDEDGVLRHYPRGDSLVGAARHGVLVPDAVDDGADGGAERAETLMRGTRVRWHGTLDDLRARDVPLLPAARFVAAGMSLLGAALEQAPALEPRALVDAIEALPVSDEEIFAQVRGRTVFVGANAAGTFDYIATPAGSPEPGVMLHWNAWQDFAGDAFLIEPGPWAVVVAALAVVAAVTFAGRRGAGLRRPAATAGVLAVVALGGSALAFNRGLWLAPAAPTAGAAIAFTAAAVESFRCERMRKREIQGWFGAYVSPAVVRRLVENPAALKLGGERREVSVFFSDLVGFTTLSEKLPADELVRLVNTCLEELSAAIFDHGGYLDKYIGDAVMAVFGSPEELPNHALAATLAALDSQRRLAALNERFAVELPGVQLGMRIGINTGEAIVGNVGSERKRNYTVLGDTVNLASRLEGANKECHTQILLGPLTAARVAGAILTRPVARLRVKGRTQAVEVHEPLIAVARADDATRRFAAASQAGFAAFSAGRFDEAARAYGDALDLRPDDLVTMRYLGDARRLAASPPPPDWEPILSLESK